MIIATIVTNRSTYRVLGATEADCLTTFKNEKPDYRIEQIYFSDVDFTSNQQS